MDSSAMEGLDQLLPEILSHIFGFLRVEDRKAVRLVSKKWNALCSCPSIIRSEKFLFRDGYSLEKIDAFLRNCQRVRPTIEFYGLQLTTLPSESTWRRIGDRVLFLSTVDCKMSTEVGKNIFLRCPNMRTYKSLSFWERPHPLCSPEMLDELIQLNVIRPKMTSFQLYVDELSEIPDDFLQKLFKIFPRISTLGTGYPFNRLFSVNIGRDIGSLQGTFDPALIKELTFNLRPTSYGWLQELMNMPRIKLQKLELTFAVNHCVIVWDQLKKFVRDQSELEILKITILSRALRMDDDTKMALFESLSICPKLVEFCLYSTGQRLKVCEVLKILRMISASKLKCFTLSNAILDCDVGVREVDLSDSLPPLANRTLQTLFLHSQRGMRTLGDLISLSMLRHFCNLRHLELSVASDKVLQTIFQYHIHLRTLSLRDIGNCTAFGFTGRKVNSSDPERITYSISRLSELTRLELEGSILDEWIDSTLREFSFPRLKFLRLNLWALEKDISIDFLPAAVPSLEILVLNGFNVPRPHLLDVCRHLHGLKTLSCIPFDDGDVSELFIAQPSLKYVITESFFRAHFQDHSENHNIRFKYTRSLHALKEVLNASHGGYLYSPMRIWVLNSLPIRTEFLELVNRDDFVLKYEFSAGLKHSKMFVYTYKISLRLIST